MLLTCTEDENPMAERKNTIGFQSEIQPGVRDAVSGGGFRRLITCHSVFQRGISPITGPAAGAQSCGLYMTAGARANGVSRVPFSPALCSTPCALKAPLS